MCVNEVRLLCAQKKILWPTEGELAPIAKMAACINPREYQGPLFSALLGNLGDYLGSYGFRIFDPWDLYGLACFICEPWISTWRPWGSVAFTELLSGFFGVFLLFLSSDLDGTLRKFGHAQGLC